MPDTLAMHQVDVLAAVASNPFPTKWFSALASAAEPKHWHLSKVDLVQSKVVTVSDISNLPSSTASVPSILTCAKWAVGLTSARCPPGGMGGHLKGQCATMGRGIGEASVLMCSVSSLPQQPAQLGLNGRRICPDGGTDSMHSHAARIGLLRSHQVAEGPTHWPLGSAGWKAVPRGWWGCWVWELLGCPHMQDPQDVASTSSASIPHGAGVLAPMHTLCRCKSLLRHKNTPRPCASNPKTYEERSKKRALGQSLGSMGGGVELDPPPAGPVHLGAEALRVRLTPLHGTACCQPWVGLQPRMQVQAILGYSR